MFKKISIVTLFAIVAMSATACSNFQLPDSIPIPFTDSQITISPYSVPDAQSNQLNQTDQSNAPDNSTIPQTGLNGGNNTNPGNGQAPTLRGNNRAPISPNNNNQVPNVRGNNQAPILPNNNNQAPLQGNVPAAGLEMFRQLGGQAGVVTAVSSNQITLKNPRNTSDNISVGSSTIIVVPGISNATVSNIQVGDRVVADVPNGQTTATFVMDMPKNFKNDIELGMVQTNSNGSITLRARGGTDTLATSSTTQVLKLANGGVTTGALSDLQTGNLIFAVGTGSSSNFAAQVIFELPQRSDLDFRRNGKDFQSRR